MPVHLPGCLRTGAHLEHFSLRFSTLTVDVRQSEDLGRLQRCSISHGDIVRPFQVSRPLRHLFMEIKLLWDAIQMCVCLHCKRQLVRFNIEMVLEFARNTEWIDLARSDCTWVPLTLIGLKRWQKMLFKVLFLLFRRLSVWSFRVHTTDFILKFLSELVLLFLPRLARI